MRSQDIQIISMPVFVRGLWSPRTTVSPVTYRPDILLPSRRRDSVQRIDRQVCCSLIIAIRIIRVKVKGCPKILVKEGIDQAPLWSEMNVGQRYFTGGEHSKPLCHKGASIQLAYLNIYTTLSKPVFLGLYN